MGQGGQWWRVGQRWRMMDEDEDQEQTGQEGRVTGQGWRMMRPGLGGEWDKVERQKRGRDEGQMGLG